MTTSLSGSTGSPEPDESVAALRAALDDALDDLPRYMAVSQPEDGWLPGQPGRPTMKACVYVDDVREMLRRAGRADA
jgi:hypothetical protein